MNSNIDTVTVKPATAWISYVHDSLHEVFNMMLGMKVTPCEDAKLNAELTAIVVLAGSFKARVPGVADTCMLSIPTTITGADYQVHPLRGGQRFEMLVRCDGE